MRVSLSLRLVTRLGQSSLSLQAVTGLCRRFFLAVHNVDKSFRTHARRTSERFEQYAKTVKRRVVQAI